MQTGNFDTFTITFVFCITLRSIYSKTFTCTTNYIQQVGIELKSMLTNRKKSTKLLSLSTTESFNIRITKFLLIIVFQTTVSNKKICFKYEKTQLTQTHHFCWGRKRVRFLAILYRGSAIPCIHRE